MLTFPHAGASLMTYLSLSLALSLSLSCLAQLAKLIRKVRTRKKLPPTIVLQLLLQPTAATTDV